MQKLLTILLFLTASTTINAQEWQTDLKKSKALAQEKNQKIILVFSGSDWCAPCIKLENDIWKSDVFKTYAKDNFVMLRADFPRRKKNQLPKEQRVKNNNLAEKYNSNGYFPLVVVLDKNAKVLGTTGYKKKSPEEYIELLNSF